MRAEEHGKVEALEALQIERRARGMAQDILQLTQRNSDDDKRKFEAKIAELEAAAEEVALTLDRKQERITFLEDLHEAHGNFENRIDAAHETFCESFRELRSEMLDSVLTAYGMLISSTVPEMR